MAYNFNRNFGQGAYGQGSRLGFQGGGAVPPMQPLDIRREGDRMLDVSSLMPYNRGWGGPVRHAASPGGFTERQGFNINDFIASAEKSQGYGNDAMDELIAFNKIKELLGHTLGREAVVKTGVDTGNLHAGKVKFYSPYPQAQPVQGFQFGGRAGKRHSIGSLGLGHNVAMEKALDALTDAKDKVTGFWDTAGGWIKGAGGLAQILSNFIPGVGPAISTGIGAGVEGLGTLVAESKYKDVETPQNIIDRQTGVTGPVVRAGDWGKLKDAYGDLREFGRSAGRKIRTSIASSLPERYLKAKAADLLQKQMQGGLKPFESPAGRLEVPVRPDMPIQMDTAQMIGDLPVPAFQPHQSPSIWKGNWFPGWEGSSQMGGGWTPPSGSGRLGG